MRVLGYCRAGVCGRGFKLTKKDKQKGLTAEKKLKRHMKELHEREQKKRLTKGRQGHKLSEKEKTKLKKYKSAAVGVQRQSVNVNDLFQVLKERGMRCKVVNDVDAALDRNARAWVNEMASANEAAALVVVSRDADFVPLLEKARGKGLLTVSISPNDNQQTRSLVVISFWKLGPNGTRKSL